MDRTNTVFRVSASLDPGSALAKNAVVTLAAILLFSLFAFRCSVVWGEHVFGTQNVTLYPIADSYVNSSDPNANYGDKKTIYVRGSDNCLYLKFDLGSIPTNAVITSAKLSLDFLYGSQWSGTLGLAYIGCFYCWDLSWTEMGLTFNNRPSFASESASTRSFGMLEYAGYKSWSVTGDANAALTSGYLTEVLRFTSGSGTMLVASRESNSRPELFVEYTTGAIHNITLESLQDTAVTSNLGYVRFSGQESPLPLGIRAVAGQYPVEYLGGYQFTSWRTEGGVSVLDGSGRSTKVTVSDDGTLTAMGNAEQFTYRYDDGTRESYSGARAGNMLAVRVTPSFVGELQSACFLISQLGYSGNTFRARVMDSEWNDLIPAVDATASAPGWLEVDLSQHHLVVRKDFYIVMEYLFDYDPDLGLDTSSPNPQRSWDWNGTTWRTSYGNYMIRCTTTSVPSAKVIGLLNVSVTPAYLSGGGRATVVGAIKPVVAGANIMLTYTMPDSTTIVRTVSTHMNGTFKDFLVPLQVGSWKVAASWDGDASYEGSESAACAFQVSKGTSYISCSTPWQIGYGHAANVSGTINPPLSLPVKLEYSTDGGTTWSPLADLMSEPDGRFSCLWTPLSVGSVKVRASFEGNEAIAGSTSYPASMNVAKVPESFSAMSAALLLLGFMARRIVWTEWGVAPAHGRNLREEGRNE